MRGKCLAQYLNGEWLRQLLTLNNLEPPQMIEKIVKIKINHSFDEKINGVRTIRKHLN